VLNTRDAWQHRVLVAAITIIVTLLSSQLSLAAPSIEGIQTYQQNVHLNPEHQQNLADDVTRYQNADNLWDVLRDEFSLDHAENNPAVQEKIEWFMNNQDFLMRSMTRAAPYLYYILQQVRKRHLPAELVLLPIIESGYNPFATSNVGATGIWQLMSGTASGLGVQKDWWYDGRRDVIASTRAALNYLAYLQSFFDGNWLLAIAAYNTGEGNVLAAIRRNIRDGQDTDFWSLPLAQQTKDYVPSLLALATIISHPSQYPIYLPAVRNAPYLGQVDTGSQINLRYAASLAGISYEKISQLNPGLSRSAMSSKGPYKLVLPIENVEQFSENFARTPLNTNVIQWSHYHVKPGDSLAFIAKRYNTTPTAIRKLNHLASKKTISRGTNLLIPNKSAKRDVDDSDSGAPVLDIAEVSHPKHSNKIINNKAVMTAMSHSGGTYRLSPGDTIYMVRPKDTLAQLAKRYHLNEATLAAANKLSGKKLTPGKTLIIPTHFSPSMVAIKSAKPKLNTKDIVYKVKHGDTIAKIARRFKTSPSAIRLANLVDDDSLHTGLKIIIPTRFAG
jgi:membrane-bound lytic murein transglycosylase D